MLLLSVNHYLGKSIGRLLCTTLFIERFLKGCGVEFEVKYLNHILPCLLSKIYQPMVTVRGAFDYSYNQDIPYGVDYITSRIIRRHVLFHINERTINLRILESLIDEKTSR